MSLATQFELLTANKDIATQLSAVQDLKPFQDEYNRMIVSGLIQKKPYSLAPVDALGAAIPGQTTYQVTIGS